MTIELSIWTVGFARAILPPKVQFAAILPSNVQLAVADILLGEREGHGRFCIKTCRQHIKNETLYLACAELHELRVVLKILFPMQSRSRNRCN